MVIYARAWHTGSCLRIRGGPFALLVLAKTLRESVADTFISQVHVLPANKAARYAHTTTYCQNRPFLATCTSCACCEALGFPYEYLGVWNSVCEHLGQKPHSHPA